MRPSRQVASSLGSVDTLWNLGSRLIDTGRVVFGLKREDGWVEERWKDVCSVWSAFAGIDTEVASAGVLGGGRAVDMM